MGVECSLRSMERQRSSNSVVNRSLKGTARPNSLASGRPVRFYLYLASGGQEAAGEGL